MLGWLFGQKPVAKNRTLIGNLDALERKTFFIRYKGEELEVPEMTVRDYAEFIALLQEIEDKTEAKDVDGITEAYEDVIGLCVPSLSGRRIRKMSLVDQTAFVAAILKHHGVDPMKSLDGKKKAAPIAAK